MNNKSYPQDCNILGKALVCCNNNVYKDFVDYLRKYEKCVKTT